MTSQSPPSLLSLATDSALLNLSHFSDLSSLPDHILLDLILRTLRAGKLNEKILKLFVATGKEEILARIEALNIQHILTPVLPTKMSLASVKDNEIDIVIGALHSDVTSFMNEWRPVFSRFHLIIVQDPELKGQIKIPEGFNVNVYTKSDIDRVVGSTYSALLFSGYSCRYFGYLISQKKYIISFDDDCLPAKDEKGNFIDPVAQHITNLATPATPFFFNTLYDPFRKGADFVRGYPFSLRSGVTCAVSCGLWLNLADYDAPTQALRPGSRNSRYVDAVMTVPARSMIPISGINIAFDRGVIGPAFFPGLRLAGEGKVRWETMEDIFNGMCVKVICDHLGMGVKTGLPYVWRKEGGDAIESLRKEWEGVKLMEDVVPFFQSVMLSPTAVTAEDCMIEMAAAVKKQLGKSHKIFVSAAEAMLQWVSLWKNTPQVAQLRGQIFPH